MKLKASPISKTQRFLGNLTAILLLTGLLACTPSEPKQTIQVPDEVQTVTHPDLTGLEPQALKVLEAQKQECENLQKNPEEPDHKKAESWGKVGSLYFAFSYRPAAETCLQNAHVLAPSNFLWPYLLGNLYEEMNAPDKALFWLEKAISLKSDSAPVNVRVADAYREAGKEEQARALYEAALKIDAESVGAFFGLGQLEASQGNHEKAIELFAKVLARQARASSVNYAMALSYQAIGNTVEAEKHMGLNGNVKPFVDDPFMAQVYTPRARTHYMMAETLRLADKSEDAIPHYDLVVELDPTNPGPRLGRMLNLVRLGRHYDAVVRIQDDLTVFPSLMPAHHTLARLSATSTDDRVRNGKRALLILEAMKKNGVSAEMTETLAMAFAENGRFDDAILAQNKAIEMARENKDEEFAKRLEAGIQQYKEKKPCRTPWPENDPLFKMVTIK